MSQLYKPPSPNRGFGFSLLLGLFCAGLLFMLVSWAQLFQSPQKTEEFFEAIEVATPPPPPPPEVPDVPPPDEQEEPPPELNTPPPMPSLEQLELSLNPGTGGDIHIDGSLQFDLTTESAEEMIRLFGFDELDEIPRLVREGRPNSQQSAEFQRVMRRQGPKQVILLVVLDERGAISVVDVVSYTHAALIPSAKQAAESSRFSPPMRNGVPVRAKYTWPLSF
ncbi:MAG: energy transducer TonB [Opitutales bacterium]|jgi:periplasmic protein TonB|nr:energy transducer TonB [Opitutales bacterium]MDP4694196.1 energy transducer TonB [Opitutales bacterium]MDP4777666.1 energy transducer TonB [Opitutales bacterium]MDP5078936.1 energy transducer TonB [Opitutales bacterium]